MELMWGNATVPELATTHLFREFQCSWQGLAVFPGSCLDMHHRKLE